MINSDFLGNLAYSVWYQLGMPSANSVQSISGYFCSTPAVGQLNNLTAGCWLPFGFSGVGTWNYDVWNPYGTDSGLLTPAEGELLALMYQVIYYDRLVNSLIGPGGFVSGVNTQNLPVTTLKDGDSTIQYMNPAQAAQIYESRRTQAVKDLRFAANTYNVNTQGSQMPRTNGFFSIWPASYNGPY